MENSFPDVISFATNKSWGLGLDLYPVQVFILKAMFGLEFERKKKTISIWEDHRKEVRAHFLTEWEYLQFLKDHGRISPTYEEGQSRLVTILLGGRRGSKSFLGSIVTVYNSVRLGQSEETLQFYRSNSHYSHHSGYVVTRQDLVWEMASVLRGLAGKVLKIAPGNSKPIIASDGNWNYVPLKIGVAPCSFRGLNGPAYGTLVLDDLAHFNNVGQQCQAIEDCKDIGYKLSRSESVYYSHSPGPCAYGDLGKVFVVSSLNSAFPLDTFFYQTWQSGMQSSRRNPLSLRVPTWEINENVDPVFLDGEHHKDPGMFRVEYGAEWSPEEELKS